MKKVLFLTTFLLIVFSAFSQAPQKLSYQAVIRNSSNALVTNASIGMRVSILQGSSTGAVVFQEISPNPKTDANGLVSIEIGGGIALTGTFATINWANGLYFVKIETDPTGGTNYGISGTSQLLSTPYALYANTAGNSNPQTLSINGSTLSLSNGGGAVSIPRDVVVMNSSNYQSISISDDKIVNVQGGITLNSDLNTLSNNGLFITGGSFNGQGNALYLGNNTVVSGVKFTNSVVIKGGSGSQFINCTFDAIRNLPPNSSLVGCQIANLNFDNTTNQIAYISNCTITNSTITRVRQISNCTISNTTLGGNPSNFVVNASNNDFTSGCIVYLAGSFTGNTCKDTRLLGFCTGSSPINITGNNFTASNMTTNQIQIDVTDSYRYSTIISNNNFFGSSSSPVSEHVRLTGTYAGTRYLTRFSNNTAIGGSPAASRFLTISTSGQIYHMVNDNIYLYTGSLGVNNTTYITDRNNVQY